jgi:tetratricopeptide (TPR) repeat protein
MDEVVTLDRNKAAYYLLLGQSQVNIPSLRRMAEKNLQRAIELDSWNADAYYSLGVLFINENMKRRAEGFLRKAVSINPDHDQARKKLDSLLHVKPQKKSRFSLFSKGKKKS